MKSSDLKISGAVMRPIGIGLRGWLGAKMGQLWFGSAWK